MPESEAIGMASHVVKINELADAIMEGLNEYAELATEEMKEAVKNASTTVRKEIKDHAPSDTGKYAKSWTAKKVRETSQTLTMVVHSKNRFQLAHLLEFGHALRNGGRYEGKSHIAPAEQKGMEQLKEEIERALKG